MQNQIAVITITTLLMTQHYVIPSSTCELKKQDFSESEFEISSTSEYLELNRKFIKMVTDDEVPIMSKNIYPDSRVEHNGFVYYSNDEGLFVQQKNSTTTRTKIKGLPEYTNIFLDKNFNLIYFGTNNGLSVSICGGKKANKISSTNGIAVDFGVVDSNGNVYFGNDGNNEKSIENMFVLGKVDQRLSKISGIEQSLGGYTIESLRNPNKIARDSRNNVYVGAYSGRIYLIESGETTATIFKDMKSNGGVTSIVVDSKDNVYFRTNHALYILKNNEKKLTKIFDLIDDFNYFVSIDKSDNLYFQFTSKMYVLKSEVVTASAIDMVTKSSGTHNFTNLQNFQVKNKILYFTSSTGNNGNKETIFALKPNETRLSEIQTTDSIISLAIDNSNNIYFVAFSDDLEKLVPFVLRKNSNIPIEIRGITGHLSHVFTDNKNNVYFGSGNGLHVLPDDEVTPFKLRGTESQVSSFVVDKNDNVYFGTDYDGAFVLKSGELEATKIDGINTKFGYYVEVYRDRSYDVVYFKTGGALYKLNGGEVFVKTVSEGFSPESYLTNCMNDTLYVQANGDENSKVLSVKYNDKEASHVTELAGQVLSMRLDSLNNLYLITDNNQLHMLRPGKSKSKILAKNRKFSSLNVDRDDNVYVSTSDGVFYVVRSGATELTKIENIYGDFKNYVGNDDGDSFFLTATSDKGKGLFLIRNKVPIETMFRNRNLGEIDNNEDETVFNILNYLNLQHNHQLSKNKNKIIRKTSTSAAILATKGKFKGSFNVTFAIKDKLDDNVTNFEFTKLLEKAIYFDHVTKNSFNFRTFRHKKEISDITVSMVNLKFSPIELATNGEPISSVEFKQICFNKKRIANTSPVPQTIKVPECNYDTKETILFQVMNGLDKTDKKMKATVNSVLNSDDENVVLNYLNNKDNEQAKITLSSAFDLSNLDKHSNEVTLQNFLEDEQEIIIPPKQRILVNYSVRTFISESELNLKQKIRGALVAKIRHTDQSDETVQITIKEAMQTLKKFNLLPSEMTINNDNSVMFTGRAKLIVKRESEPKIIRNFFNI